MLFVLSRIGGSNIQAKDTEVGGKRCSGAIQCKLGHIREIWIRSADKDIYNTPVVPQGRMKSLRRVIEEGKVSPICPL